MKDIDDNEALPAAFIFMKNYPARAALLFLNWNKIYRKEIIV